MAENKTQQAAKQTSSKSARSQQQKAEVTASMPQEDVAKLPQNEQKAHEELVAAPFGTGKAYRLADPTTQYTDVETGWTLAGDQAKTLPEGYHSDTLARIKEGFLVEADAPTAQIEVMDAEAQAAANSQPNSEAPSDKG